jgi:hypothetical protein
MAREAWRSGSVEEAVRGAVGLLAPPCPFEGSPSKAACPACPERSAAESKGAASKRCRRSALRSSGQNSATAVHRARRHWVAFGAARTLARQSRNRNRTASSGVISWICTSRSFLTLCEKFLAACEQFGLVRYRCLARPFMGNVQHSAAALHSPALRVGEGRTLAPSTRSSARESWEWTKHGD